MPRRPSEIFYGAQISVSQEEPDLDTINQAILETPNQIQAKYDQLSVFSSPLVKKMVAENAADLERMERRNRWPLAGKEMFVKLARDSQLGLGNRNMSTINPTSAPTPTRSGTGRYAMLAPPREHNMWLRSQERARKERFDTA